MVGVKSGVRTAVFLAITKTLPLLIFIVVGLFFVSAPLATSVHAKPRIGGRWATAVLLLLFAYAGFENTAAPAGEFKNPRRDVPFALIVQIVIVTLIYSAVQWVALGTLPGVVDSKTPLADAAARLPGRLGRAADDGGRGDLDPRHQQQHGALGTALPLRAGPGRLRPAALGGPASALPHAGGGDPDADGHRPAAGLLRLLRAARHALGGGAAGHLLRHGPGRAGAAAKLPQTGAFRLPGGPVIPVAAAALCVVFAASATRATSSPARSRSPWVG